MNIHQKLILSIQGELYIIDLQKVMYLQADDHYTIVYYSTGAHFMVPFGLSKVEAAIAETCPDDYRFVRISRKYILNKSHIFHINVIKQTVHLTDEHGIGHALHTPKPALRELMTSLQIASQDK